MQAGPRTQHSLTQKPLRGQKPVCSEASLCASEKAPCGEGAKSLRGEESVRPEEPLLTENPLTCDPWKVLPQEGRTASLGGDAVPTRTRGTWMPRPLPHRTEYGAAARP